MKTRIALGIVAAAALLVGALETPAKADTLKTIQDAYTVGYTLTLAYECEGMLSDTIVKKLEEAVNYIPDMRAYQLGADQFYIVHSAEIDAGGTSETACKVAVAKGAQ